MTQTEAIDRLTSLAPVYADVRPKHRLDNDGEELPYVLMGEYARIALGWARDSNDAALERLARLLEQLYASGDEATVNLLTVGLLEALQNCAESAGITPDAVRAHLGPRARQEWDDLNDFWLRKA